MWGVLIVPSSSPTLWPIYDGLDVNVTSDITWFHLNHEMASRRIYKHSLYGGHSIISSAPLFLSFKASSIWEGALDLSPQNPIWRKINLLYRG